RITASQHAQGAVTMIARASPWIFIRERPVPRTGPVYARTPPTCQEWRMCIRNEQIWGKSARNRCDFPASFTEAFNLSDVLQQVSAFFR
ncbi:hypothetical protein ACCS96_49830, partial [Rhizobium ruizarguesonis]